MASPSYEVLKLVALRVSDVTPHHCEIAAEKGYEEANADTDSAPDGNLTLGDEIHEVAEELRDKKRTAPCFLFLTR